MSKFIKIFDQPNLVVTLTFSNKVLTQSSLSRGDKKGFYCDAPVDSFYFKWLQAYALKKPTPFPLDNQTLTPFSQSVLKILTNIPFGETLTYGEIAALAGSPKAARAVGNICSGNSLPLFIPCHRVLPSSGGLGGFAFGPEIKQALLDFENS